MSGGAAGGEGFAAEFAELVAEGEFDGLFEVVLGGADGAAGDRCGSGRGACCAGGVGDAAGEGS